MRVVLDSWALLAWLQDEGKAADSVDAYLSRAEAGHDEVFVSMINVGEVFYRLARARGMETARGFLEDLRAMPITVLPTPKKLVVTAAELKANHPIAYADAFAVAAALRQAAKLVTGDPELKTLADKGVLPIDWLVR